MLMPSIFGENLLDDLFGFDYPVKTPQRIPFMAGTERT
mgnify:CR=1 FL=1